MPWVGRGAANTRGSMAGMRHCRKHGGWEGTQKRCPKCNKEDRAAWVEANRDRHNKQVRDHRASQGEARLIRERATTARIKAEVMAAYGGACVCCGESALVFLTIDHPEQNGAAHRREIFGTSVGRAGERFYRWLRRNGWPAGYRILCWNCQHATFRGACPHVQV